LLLFQEQVMMVLNRLGGISVADGYDFGKAAAKNKLAIVAQYQAKFLTSARKNGIAPKVAEAIFDQLRIAASFAFCKADSLGEAMVIYYAAYLRAHYPAEFSQGVQLVLA
jgi:DNA polymerase-3 subunit alpha